MSSVDEVAEEMAFSKNASVGISLEVSVNEVFQRRVVSIRGEHSKKSIKLINDECLHDESDQCKKELSFCGNKSDHNLHLDHTIKKPQSFRCSLSCLRKKN